MANSNPFHGRLAKRRRRAGTLAQCTAVLWQAVCAAEAVLSTAESQAQTLQACHALAQTCLAYHKLLAAGELEARVQALETAVAEGRAHALA